MRYWNGLTIHDKVEYHKKVYIIKKLYENDGERLCDLLSINNDDEIIGVSVYECNKM